MCQHDPFIIEEYKNPLIEFSCILFAQNNLTISQQHRPELTDNSDSIFLQLLLYWTCILNDPKNSSLIHLPYSHALNNIKCIFLSSGKLTLTIFFINNF